MSEQQYGDPYVIDLEVRLAAETQRAEEQTAKVYGLTEQFRDMQQVAIDWNNKAERLERELAEERRLAGIPQRDSRLKPDEREWWQIGRDGEDVTLFQKLQQSMEFGAAMDRLAVENNTKYLEERRLRQAAERRSEMALARVDELWTAKVQAEARAVAAKQALRSIIDHPALGDKNDIALAALRDPGAESS